MALFAGLPTAQFLLYWAMESSLVPSPPHPLMRRNSLVDQVEFLGLVQELALFPGSTHAQEPGNEASARA